MYCEKMTEAQARNNVETIITGAMVSLGLIADKSGSEVAKKAATDVARILDWIFTQKTEDAIETALRKIMNDVKEECR